MKFIRICLLLLLSLTYTVNAQLFKDSREMFLEAESYFLFEEYNEALPLYLTLHRENSDNDYLMYKIGVCYLNTPGQKDKAIPFLMQAIDNIDWKNKPATYKTTKAPPDALFYLGHAYHINYQFDNALKYYNRFKKEVNPKVYDLTLAEEHIKATRNAMESIKTPVFFLKNNLDEPLNSRFSESNPVVSGDEDVIVFSRKLPFYQGVFYSKKVNGEWMEPVDITPMIGSDGDCYPVSLSYSGTELFLYKVDNYVGNLYTSNYVNGEWSKIKKLNEYINTKYWESHASISSDGKTLYFTSNRPGGFGGLDIYVSQKGMNGDWGPATNFGKPVNSEFNEETPFITEDAKTLYFSSYGYFNIGGYDIFYTSKLADGRWSVPLNASYPISTPDDDLFFYPLKDGRYAYIAMSNPQKINGVTDLYRLEIFSETHPRKFRVYGTMSLADKAKVSSNSRVYVVDNVSGDTLFSSVPDSISGAFELSVAHGNYKFVFREEGFKEKNVALNLPVNNPQSEIALYTTLEPVVPEFDSKYFAEKDVLPWYNDSIPVSRKLGIEKHQIRVSTGDPVDISMDLERGSKLRIETWMDNKLVKVDTFEVKSRRFNYVVNPLPGKTLLKVYYQDRNNELIRDELTIAYVPEILPDSPSVPVLNENLQAVYNELVKNSKGDLRTVLLNINFSKEKITTPEELINYLIVQSEFNDYTKSDIRMALLAVAAINSSDASEFLANLLMKSKDPLFSLLKDIDLKKEGITSIQQLLEVIEKRTGKSDQLDEALVALAIQMAVEETSKEQQELAILYYELLKVSDGRIREILKEIEPGKSNVQSTEELIQLLINKANQNNYTGKDIERLLLTVIDSKKADLNYLRKKWAGLSAPSLSRLINRTNLQKADSPEFSTYASRVTGSAGKSDITENQILESLGALAINQSMQSRREMAILYYNMLRLADGNLKQALSTLNFEKEQISTSQELIDYLITQSDTLNYKQEDVVVLMAKISAEKDLHGFFDELTSLSSGNLQKMLKTIDLKRDNINTVDELIALLLKKAPEYGYTSEEIISIVGQLSVARSMGNQMDMLLLKQNLAVLGRSELRLAIQELDTSEIKFTSPEQLIDYLSRIADSAGYTSGDVWDVVFELGMEGQKDISDLISSMKKIANKNILKAFEEIEKGKIQINSINELIDYLVSRGEDLGYTEAEVKKLVLSQAIENQKLLKDQQEKKPKGIKIRYWFYLILLLIAVILSIRYLRKAKKQ